MACNISIITVVFSERKHIGQTIQSVLNQSYTNVEYVVVDGGSTDGTLDVIREHEEDIAYWESGQDSGISNAFNRGIKHAKGEYVALLNGGDWYRSSALSDIAAAIEEYPEADVLYGDVAMIDDDGAVKYVRQGQSDLTASHFRYRMPTIPHPTVFARRECYLQNPFDEALKYAMDYKWIRQLYEQGYRFRYLENTDPIANMRVSGRSNDGYDKTLAEVHNIARDFGDEPSISYLYNCVFRANRFRARKLLSSSTWGSKSVDAYRKLNVMLGLKRWKVD